jgi:hypothetical protein
MAPAGAGAAKTRRGRSRAFGRVERRFSRAPEQRRLYRTTDHGNPVAIQPGQFAPQQRYPGWGAFAELFVRFNRDTLTRLDVHIEISEGGEGTVIRLVPGGHAGAVPLRSALTGRVVGGLVVLPRFDWSGIGSVLSRTGWKVVPELLECPMVPGSGREVPPWVLAGPILQRLAELMRTLRRGYRDAEEVLRKPRGRILWHRYQVESMSRGRWDRLPCRFPELDTDPLLRRQIRWAVERVQLSLALSGGRDPVALSLLALALQLLEALADVSPLVPKRGVLEHQLRSRFLSRTVQQGIEAICWIVDKRGLGGGRELDGLAWTLQLDRLWEAYVETVIREEVATMGGDVAVGRLGQTVFPLDWTDSVHRTLGHLVPDIVVRKGRSVQIVDAKYKAHLAELDDARWSTLSDEIRLTEPIFTRCLPMPVYTTRMK